VVHRVLLIGSVTLKSYARLRECDRRGLLNEIIENTRGPDSNDTGDETCGDERAHMILLLPGLLEFPVARSGMSFRIVIPLQLFI
jgi:hypothetical protein